MNGEEWDTTSLLHEMHDDNFYYEYLGVNALSSSACKMLLDSPKSYYMHMKYGSSDSSSFAVGRLVHLLALEPDRFDDLYDVVPVRSRATKMYKEFESTKQHKITAADFDEADRISSALHRNEQVLSMVKGCEYEVPMCGTYDGLAFRTKADIWNPASKTLIDLKTTTNLKAFPFSADKYSYDLQCYLYCTIFGVGWQDFKFIAIDKASLDIGIYDVAESFYLRGKKKLEQAIANYKIFFVDMEDLDSYTIRGMLE